MQLEELLNSIGYDNKTIAINLPEEFKSRDRELELSFLINTHTDRDLYKAVQNGKIKMVRAFDIDVAYLDQNDDDNPRFDISLNLFSEVNKDDLQDIQPYIKAWFKFKFTSEEEDSIRMKFNYEVEPGKLSTIINKARDMGLWFINKDGRVYEATTVNGEPFTFYVMNCHTRFSEFKYIEIEFDSMQKLKDFKFENYFSFISSENVKPMHFRLSEYYKYFG